MLLLLCIGGLVLWQIEPPIPPLGIPLRQMQGTWELVSLNGKPVISDAPVTMTFDGYEYYGRSFCNDARGQFFYDDEEFSEWVRLDTWTLLGCPYEGEYYDVWFYGALGGSVDVTDDRLTIVEPYNHGNLEYIRMEQAQE